MAGPGGVWVVGEDTPPLAAFVRALARAGDDRPVTYFGNSSAHSVSARGNPSSAWDIVRDSLFDWGGVLEGLGGVGVGVVAAREGVASWDDLDAVAATDPSVEARYVEAAELVDRWGVALADCGGDTLDHAAVRALVARLRAYIASRPPLDELADSLASLLSQSDRLCRGESVDVPAALGAARAEVSSASSGRGWVWPLVLAGVVAALGVVIWRGA